MADDGRRRERLTRCFHEREGRVADGDQGQRAIRFAFAPMLSISGPVAGPTTIARMLNVAATRPAVARSKPATSCR
jgi:hypothetical protein